MDPEKYTLTKPEVRPPPKSPPQDTPPVSQTMMTTHSTEDAIAANKEETGSQHQNDFKQIMQGLQEGSLGVNAWLLKKKECAAICMQVSNIETKERSPHRTMTFQTMKRLRTSAKRAITNTKLPRQRTSYRLRMRLCFKLLGPE
jgi:hypothetical protein